jgi:hypothetical protein
LTETNVARDLGSFNHPYLSRAKDTTTHLQKTQVNSHFPETIMKLPECLVGYTVASHYRKA